MQHWDGNTILYKAQDNPVSPNRLIQDINRGEVDKTCSRSRSGPNTLKNKTGMADSVHVWSNLIFTSLVSPSYRWGNWGPWWLNNLAAVAQKVAQLSWSMIHLPPKIFVRHNTSSRGASCWRFVRDQGLLSEVELPDWCILPIHTNPSRFHYTQKTQVTVVQKFPWNLPCWTLLQWKLVFPLVLTPKQDKPCVQPAFTV